MRDPYTPPTAPPKPEGDTRPKRPTSVTWAMLLCVMWIFATYPVFRLAQRTNHFDWLLGIIFLTVVFAIAVTFIVPRSRLRQRALAAVYTLCLLRMAQTILVTAKEAPTSITIQKIVIWLGLTSLFIWGLMKLLTGPAALRYFEDRSKN